MNDAITLLDHAGDQSPGQPQLLAGGTDLLTLMKQEIMAPTLLIDIKRLPELDDVIAPSPEGLTIGALSTLAQLEVDPLVRGSYPALAEAARVAATPQLRNMATIGGNLLQRPRCWYFRSEHVHCWLKGGHDCPAVEGENQHHAVFGNSPCHATHASDLATALVALGAEVNLRGPHEDRSVPLDAFFALPNEVRRTEHVLAANEVIVSISLPHQPMEARSTYLKAMDRKAWAFALVGVGAWLVIDEGQIVDARLVLGGVAPIPWRVPDAEALLVRAEPGPALFDRVAQVALQGATPLSGNGYKIQLATAMVRRALTEISAPSWSAIA
jgi:xanthine dehydrogenase YagS FAD-binding subunit